jgi:translocation and assembly module TamB
VNVNGEVTQSGGATAGQVSVTGPLDSFANLDGNIADGGEADIAFDAVLGQIEKFVPQLAGDITAQGRATRRDEVWQVDVDVKEQGGSMLDLTGNMQADGSVDARYDATIATIERFVPQLQGAITAKGNASRIENAWDVSAEVNGPTGSVARLDGSMAADGTVDATYDATIARIERFVPQLSGALKAKGTAQRVEETWTVASDVNGPSGSSIIFAGSMTPEGTIDATYNASIVRIERFVPDFPGTATAKGTAQREGTLWTIVTDATGPGGLSLDLGGTVDQESLLADITAKGGVQLGVANTFIAPNSVRGTANFDLALRGEARPDSLSGTIATSNTTVAIPAVRQAIDDLDAQITLVGGRANLSATAGLRAGGRVVVSGPVDLTAPYNASIITEIQQLILTDNVVFDSSANGRLAYTGALAGSGQLAGDIRFGETNININALSGTASAAPIPVITHIGETGSQYATRKHAGLIKKDDGGGDGPDIGLDIRLIAENKVFVRGRGLQAELGGNILVRGTVAKPAPSGQIDLIRGVFGLLGRRLDLTKGLVTLQGNLSPYMEFAASTSTSDGDATLEISGPITQPTVNVTSDPERPSEEALAMLLFGNQFSQLSPIKIAQIAASLATLSGSGGSVGASAREGLGVDTVDIGTDDDGNAQFGVGKYIADGVYTDLTVNAEGDTEVNLNLDISDSLTVKGSVDRQGETGIGLFFERDY